MAQNKAGREIQRGTLLDTPELYPESRGDDLKETLAPHWRITNPGHGKTVRQDEQSFILFSFLKDNTYHRDSICH